MRVPLRAICMSIAVLMVATLLWTPSVAAPAPLANNLGLRTIPFRIVNNSGRPGNLFLYVEGEVPSQGSRHYFLSNVNGDVTIIPKQDPPGAPIGLNLGTATTVDVTLPQLNAARIYFSIGAPLVVYASADGAPPSAPPGWVPTDPNFKTDFDWAEFTWNNDAPNSKFTTTLGMNVTQVDMLGFAMLLALKGKRDDGQVVTRKSGFADESARVKILAGLSSAGEPWTKLIMTANGGPALRVIAPYHGIALGLFPANQLDAYIASVWKMYSGGKNMLIGMAENHAYGGTVVNGEMVFNEIGGSDPQFKFARPTTNAAYQNFLPAIPCPPENQTPPCNRARVVGAYMAAGFMRTTLVTNTHLNTCSVDMFYEDDPVNVYAKLFHKFGRTHEAYSFGFDDTCDQSSFIQIHNPQSLTITIQKY